MDRVLTVLLTHQPARCVAAMLAWWQRTVPAVDILIVHGGARAEFDAVAHGARLFVDDPRLHTVDHQRECQSYTAIFRAVAAWMRGRDFTHVLFCEYDHLPLATDLPARYLAQLAAEKADVLGYHVRRVDGTNHPHYLYHRHDPEFLRTWQRLSVRSERGVVLSMFGSGSFWTRAAFDAVGQIAEPLRMYLEIYLPTLVHHLGYRVRDLADQNAWVNVEPERDGDVDAARRGGAWALHPVKRLWT